MIVPDLPSEPMGTLSQASQSLLSLHKRPELQESSPRQGKIYSLFVKLNDKFSLTTLNLKYLLNSRIDIIPARNNGTKLRVDNFEFSPVTRSKNYLYMECTTAGCKVSCRFIRKTRQVDKLHNSHNHFVPLVSQQVKDELRAGISGAASTDSRPREVLNEIRSTVRDKYGIDAIPYMGKSLTNTKAISRARASNLKLPKSPETFEELLEENVDLKFRVNDDKEVWYHVLEDENTVDEFDILFLSSTGTRGLSANKTWAVDGTFNIVSTCSLFQQLWIIAVRTNSGSWAPLAFALMRRKTQESYTRVLEYIRDQLGVTEPNQTYLDFEKSEHNAFLEVYPGCILLGCDTHWKRALRTNLVKCRLEKEMNESVPLQQYYHKLWALSLVDEESVETAFDFLQSPDEIPLKSTMDRTEEELIEIQEYNRRLLNFLRYYQKTWVGESIPSGGRKQPLFDKKLWNKNKAILQEEDLTTNGSEAINLQISSSIDTKKKKNLYNVFMKIRQEESKSVSNLMTAATGEREGSHNPGRLTAILTAKKKRKSLVSEFKKDGVDLKTFLQVASSLYDYSKL